MYMYNCVYFLLFIYRNDLFASNHTCLHVVRLVLKSQQINSNEETSWNKFYNYENWSNLWLINIKQKEIYI